MSRSRILVPRRKDCFQWSAIERSRNGNHWGIRAFAWFKVFYKFQIGQIGLDEADPTKKEKTVSAHTICTHRGKASLRHWQQDNTFTPSKSYSFINKCTLHSFSFGLSLVFDDLHHHSLWSRTVLGPLLFQVTFVNCHWVSSRGFGNFTTTTCSKRWALFFHRWLHASHWLTLNFFLWIAGSCLVFPGRYQVLIRRLHPLNPLMGILSLKRVL